MRLTPSRSHPSFGAFMTVLRYTVRSGTFKHCHTLCQRNRLPARLEIPSQASRHISSTSAFTPSRGNHHSKPEQWLPQPIVQRAVTSLLNDTFKNGTFSWDFVISSSLFILLEAFYHEKSALQLSPTGILASLRKLKYERVNLSLDSGRLSAKIDLSIPAGKNCSESITYHLAEHEDPKYNALDIVKLLYIQARRAKAISLPRSSTEGSVSWLHPEWPIIPEAHSPRVLFEKSYQIKHLATLHWRLAVLAAGIEVPNIDFDSMKPFLESTHARHNLLPNFMDLEPQMHLSPRTFVETLVNIADDPPEKCAASAEAWRERLSTYHACPFGCGLSQMLIHKVRDHIHVCPYRSSETKAEFLHKETVKVERCPYCDSRFGRSSDVNRHVRLFHQRYKPFSCSSPGCMSTKKFVHLGQWWSHFEKVHAFKKSNHQRCIICHSGNMKTRSGFYLHLRVHHPELSREQRSVVMKEHFPAPQPSGQLRYTLKLEPDGPLLPHTRLLRKKPDIKKAVRKAAKSS